MAEVGDAGPPAGRRGRVGEAGPAVKELLPLAVRPRLREVPAPAWTLAQAYVSQKSAQLPPATRRV